VSMHSHYKDADEVTRILDSWQVDISGRLLPSELESLIKFLKRLGESHSLAGHGGREKNPPFCL
jgi:hypothetical protein